MSPGAPPARNHGLDFWRAWSSLADSGVCEGLSVTLLSHHPHASHHHAVPEAKSNAVLSMKARCDACKAVIPNSTRLTQMDVWEVLRAVLGREVRFVSLY